MTWSGGLRSLALPRPVESTLARAWPLALCAGAGRIPLWLVHGTAGGVPATLAVAGHHPGADYACRYFFDAPPERKLVGSALPWRVENALAGLTGHADLSIARADRFTASCLFRNACLRVPEWIAAGLPTPQDPALTARANHSVREDMRLTRRERMEVAISRDAGDFDLFYDGYYAPFTLARHAGLAHLRPKPWLRLRLCRGGILWILRAGERIAGMLFEEDGGILRLRAEGTLQGDAGMMKIGAISALYFHAMRYARERGFRYLDFGGSRALLADGLLRYKRKWSMHVGVKPDNHYYLLVRWERWGPAVAAFLARVPLIHEARGRLYGVVGLDAARPATEEDAERVRHLFWMEGLGELRIVSGSGWEAGAAPPPGTALLSSPAVTAAAEVAS